MNDAITPLRPARQDKGHEHPLPVTTKRAPRAFSAVDTLGTLVHGLRHGDALMAARGRGTNERLVQEDRL